MDINISFPPSGLGHANVQVSISHEADKKIVPLTANFNQSTAQVSYQVVPEPDYPSGEFSETFFITAEQATDLAIVEVSVDDEGEEVKTSSHYPD